MRRALPFLMLSLPMLTTSACRLGYELFAGDGAGASGGLDSGGSTSNGASANGSGGSGDTASGGSSDNGGSSTNGGSSANGGSSTNGGSSANGGSSTSGGAGETSGGSSGSGGMGPVGPCNDPAFATRYRLSFFNGAGEALDNFVTLFVFDPKLINYDAAGVNGVNMRFVDDDQTTVLEHHIERWDPAGNSYVWVRVPRIDAASMTDHIWLYYGGTGTGTQDETGTYDASFAGVWQLSDGANALHDSTSSAITCNWFGNGGTPAGPGVAGGGISTSGTNNGAVSAAGKLPALTSQTVTIWARPPMGGGGDQNQSLFSAEQLTGNYSGPNIQMFGTQSRVGTYVNLNYRYGGPALSLKRGLWNFVALRAVAAANNGYVEMKVNDGAWETVYSGDTSTLEATTNGAVQIGDYDASVGTTDFLGDLDQLVISSELRSDSWIDAQYRSEGGLGFWAITLAQACQ